MEPPETFKTGDLKLEHVKVKFKAYRQIPEFTVGGEKIGPYEEGETFEIPLWIAEAMEEQRYGKILEDEDERTLINKPLAFESWRSPRELAQLNGDHYPKTRRFLKRLRRLDRESFQKNLRKFEDLIQRRTYKIAVLASKGAKDEKILQNLTPEEKALYMKLRKEIEEWKKEALSLSED